MPVKDLTGGKGNATMSAPAAVVELVDTRDLKSLAFTGVPVRVRSAAPKSSPAFAGLLFGYPRRDENRRFEHEDFFCGAKGAALPHGACAENPKRHGGRSPKYSGQRHHVGARSAATKRQQTRKRLLPFLSCVAAPPFRDKTATLGFAAVRSGAAFWLSAPRREPEVCQSVEKARK